MRGRKPCKGSEGCQQHAFQRSATHGPPPCFLPVNTRARLSPIPAGIWETIAGEDGKAGSRDGPIGSSLLNRPTAMCTTPLADLVVVDSAGACLRLVTQTGEHRAGGGSRAGGRQDSGAARQRRGKAAGHNRMLHAASVDAAAGAVQIDVRVHAADAPQPASRAPCRRGEHAGWCPLLNTQLPPQPT